MKKILLCKFLFLIIAITLCLTDLYAQNVAITDEEGYTPAISAMLDVKSLNKGLLIPRLTTLQRLAVPSPVNGLMVYDTDFNSFFYHNGITWTNIPKVNTSVGIGVALFAVVNVDGDTIFAVYNDGVKVTIPEGSKGNVGGFAVSGRTQAKESVEYNYFKVTGDSTRIYINDTSSAKGNVGGFAVSGRTQTKSYPNNYFLSTPDSTRIYVNDTLLNKGNVGGFAVSGRTRTKGPTANFMDLTPKNYFIGHNSGSKTTGLYNSFVGYESGKNNEIGEYNSFFGYRTGTENISGSSNVFIGYLSGSLNTTGYRNVFIGDSAGYGNKTGRMNVFIGSESGLNNTKGYNNSFVGYLAGRSNTLGRNNLFIGTNSGFGNISGDNNIFLGNQSGYTNSTGEYNTYIGYKAGYTSNASFNSFLGYQAGMLNTSGQYNSFIGHNTGYSNTIGSSNVFIGDSTGFSNTIGNSNVMIGKNAGLSSNGNNNIFIGLNAGKNTLGDDNIAIGVFAGNSITTGNHNLIIGSSAGYSHTDQEYNVMLGTNAGFHLSAPYWAGSFNTFVGINSGYKISSGKENVFIGTNSGYWIENGTGNTIVGIDAGRSGNDHNNGYDASKNTIMGDKAGYNILESDNNVLLGYNSGFSLTTGSGNVFIGYNAGSSLTNSTSDKLYIANSSTNPPLIYGDFLLARIGLGTITPAYKLDVVGDINITGNFKINGANIVTTTIVEGDLTATGPISLSAARKVIGGTTNISIADGSISAKGAVQLSNSYNGTSQTLATTEKALNDGLSTKVTGSGFYMGKIFLNTDGSIVAPILGFDLYWDMGNDRIILTNNIKAGNNCHFWYQTQQDVNIEGLSGVILPGNAIEIGHVTDKGMEIHYGDNSGMNYYSIWIHCFMDIDSHKPIIIGHYTMF